MWCVARDPTRPAWHRRGVAGEMETFQDLRNGATKAAVIMNFQVWMSAGSGPSQKDSTGVAQPHQQKVRRSKRPRTAGPSDMSLGWKRGPDTQTGACPTQMDRWWGMEPQAPAMLLDPFVDLSSICRPCCWTLLLTCRPSTGRVTAAMVRGMRSRLASCCLPAAECLES